MKSYFSKKSISTRLIYISLLCNHTPSLNAGRFLARAIDKNARLVTIKNRGGGFPGYMSVKVNVKGKEKMKRFPYRKIMGAGYGKYFKNIRCLLCNDPFGSNADIAVGDSYFLQDTDKEGTSFCIVRNKEIHNVLKQMDTDGIITLYDGPAESVIRKAYRPLFERIKMFEIRNSIHKVLYGECVNTPIIYKGSISLRQVFGYISTTTIMRLGKYRWLWPWLIRKNKIRKLIE